jgi:YQGE family putative transporter
LSQDIRKLLTMNVVSSIVFIYIGIFVNLYIWQKNHLISEVALYNLALFISWGIAFPLSAKLLTRYSIRLLLCISALGGGLAFTYLMTVQLDNRFLWIVLLGIPVGIMFGSSSASQNLSISLAGKNNEFSSYFAALNITSQVLSMAVPFLAAKVIDRFGYNGSFALMLCFLVMMLGYSVFMPQITLPKPQNPNEIANFGRFRFYTAFSYPGAKWILLSLLASGVFLQFQNLFTLLFTFSVTQNKLLIAMLNMLYTVATLLGLLLFRRIKLNETRWLWIGTTLLAAGFLIVIIPYPAALIISNVLTSIGMFYFTTVWNAQQYRSIQHLNPVQKTSFIVWREIILVVTRCVLLGLAFYLKAFQGLWFIGIIAFTITCLLAIPIFQSRAVRENEHAQRVKYNEENLANINTNFNA